MINDEADKNIEGLFDSVKNRYQYFLDMMEGSKSVFNYAHLFFNYARLLYYKCHKTNPNCSGSN